MKLQNYTVSILVQSCTFARLLFCCRTLNICSFLGFVTFWEMAMLSLRRILRPPNFNVAQLRRAHFSVFSNPPLEEDGGTFGFARTPHGSLPMTEHTHHPQDFATGDVFSAPAGSMQLLAVPKKSVSHSRKRKRNAPKALKPHPVIIRCTACGRVKLPNFFCCTGNKMKDSNSPPN